MHLVCDLEELFSQISLESINVDSSVEAILHEVSKKPVLEYLLQDFIIKINSSDPFTNLSYLHNNGYYKIVLYHDPIRKIKLRLHVWPVTGNKNNERDVHNHRWGYYSKVIAGKIANQIYSESEKGKEYFKYKYFSKGDSNCFSIRYLGKQKLCKEKEMIQEQGSLYFQDNATLHRIETPSDELTATLIITFEQSGWIDNDLFTEQAITDDDEEQISILSLPRKVLEKELFNLINRL